MVDVRGSQQLRHADAGAISQRKLHGVVGELLTAHILYRQTVRCGESQNVTSASFKLFGLNVLRADALTKGICIKNNTQTVDASVPNQVIAVAQRKVVSVHPLTTAEHVIAGAAP